MLPHKAISSADKYTQLGPRWLKLESGNTEQWTQYEQGSIDEEAYHRVMNDTLQSWKQKLSLISSITTFFVATETQLLIPTVPENKQSASTILQVANAGLSGALVMHVFAAIVSFHAVFFLIRSRLRDGRALELEGATDGASSITTPPDSSSNSRKVAFSRDPRIAWQTNILRRCHILCMWTAAVGFVLAFVGAVCALWATMSMSVCIFSTTLAGVCFVGVFYNRVV